MRIALVTIGEPLPVGEGVHDRPLRTGYLSQLLADRGHDVTWWTSTFDHSRRRVVARDDETVRVRPGLTVRMLNGGGYRRNVSLARLLDHRTVAAKFAAAVRRHPRPDIIVSSWPPVELCTAAVEYGRETGVPVVLDMRDMWPDIFVDECPAWLRRPARMLLTPFFTEARRTSAAAAGITGMTTEMVEWGLRRADRERSRFDATFPMGYRSRVPPPDRLAEAEAFWDALGIPADPYARVICFFGNLGRQFDLDPAIASARILAERRVPARFVLCGSGERLDHYRARAADLDNVLLPGWVDEAKIHVLLRRSHAGIDPLPDRYDYLASINNKAIEYLSAGVPVISSPPRGVLAETLARLDCGASCEANDPAALAALVERACASPGDWAAKARNAAAFFERELAADRVYEAFHRHLESIVAAAPRRARQDSPLQANPDQEDDIGCPRGETTDNAH